MPSPATTRRHSRTIPRGEMILFDEIGNDIELIDSHDWRDIWQLVARPDSDEGRWDLPMPRERY